MHGGLEGDGHTQKTQRHLGMLLRIQREDYRLATSAAGVSTERCRQKAAPRARSMDERRTRGCARDSAFEDPGWRAVAGYVTSWWGWGGGD